jgi:iron complex transport system substrate-binding protein
MSRSASSDPYPERIVCLTEEPTEVLYHLGEQDRIVGISQFTVRPDEARRDKPKVSAFTSARLERILELEPDLVIGFSDIQADIARDLIKEGVEVWISNHRSVEGILAYIIRLGSLVGRHDDVLDWVADIRHGIEAVSASAARLPTRPRVYFEEWDDPMITAIRWVSEVIGIAGGDDIFSNRSTSSLAADRIIEDHTEVVRRNPDILLASWCGKKLQPRAVWDREGWDALKPVRTRTIHEVPAEIILQPGPAALTAGLAHIHEIVSTWAASP